MAEHALGIIAGNNRIVYGDTASALAEIERQDNAHRGQAVTELPDWYRERYGDKGFSPFDAEMRQKVAAAMLRTSVDAYRLCGLLSTHEEPVLLADYAATLGRAAGGYAPARVEEVVFADNAFVANDLMDGDILRASGAAAILDDLLRASLGQGLEVRHYYWLFGGFMRAEDREAFQPLLLEMLNPFDLSWDARQAFEESRAQNKEPLGCGVFEIYELSRRSSRPETLADL